MDTYIPTYNTILDICVGMRQSVVEYRESSNRDNTMVACTSKVKPDELCADY